jgi:DNA mismatch endonuclease (patch repair protein)
MGFRFRLHGQRLPGRPDIVLPRYGTVVFVHGCFWHRHAGCPRAAVPGTNRAFWRRKFAETVARDARVTRQLRQMKWRVLIVWECELSTDPQRRVARLARRIRADARGVA